jgi:signal peptidase I
LLFFLSYEGIKELFFRSVYVSSASMEPGIRPGDAIAFFPSAFGATTPFGTLPGFMEPSRGDVVLVRPPYMGDRPLLEGLGAAIARFVSLQRLGEEREPIEGAATMVVKRVVALPGDTVFMREGICYVRPRGAEHFLTEFETSKAAYDVRKPELPAGWDPAMPGSGYMERLEIPEGRYFVLGDNRGASVDSRTWGLVPREDILALALFRFWPFASFGPVQ